MLKDAEKWYPLCTQGRQGGQGGGCDPSPKPGGLFGWFVTGGEGGQCFCAQSGGPGKVFMDQRRCMGIEAILAAAVRDRAVTTAWGHT